jgi:antitoxin YefM
MSATKSFTTTQARSNLYRLIDQVAESHDPVVIIGKANNAVLVSQEDWDAIQETLYLTSIPGLRESIQTGLKTPISECDDEIQWPCTD